MAVAENNAVDGTVEIDPEPEQETEERNPESEESGDETVEEREGAEEVPEETEEEAEPEETEEPYYIEYGGRPDDLEDIVLDADWLINDEVSLMKDYGFIGGLTGLGAGLIGSAIAPFAAPVLAGGALTGALGLSAGSGYGALSERRIRKDAEKYTVLDGDELSGLLEDAYDLAEWDEEEYDWIEAAGFDPGSVQLYRSLGSHGDHYQFELSTVSGARTSTYRGKLESDSSEYEGNKTLASDTETLEQAAELLR